jgi:2-oxoglutarate/2-oxoacid ferredoxin oxidoreductase subunit alpha
VVITPTSVEDCFWATVDAFNYAERFQVPVIVLTDQGLATRMAVITAPDLSQVEQWPRKTAKDVEGRAKRYELTDDGISPMGVPGEPNGQYVATGIEHDEWGHPAYTPEIHTAMQKKRWKKLEPLSNGAARHEYYGDAQPDIAVIGFGSTFGAAREGVDMARAEGISVGAFYPRVLGPFPVDTVREFTAKASRVVVPEINFTGQLARLLRGEVGITVDSRAKCDGLPFTAEDIYEMITEAAR